MGSVPDMKAVVCMGQAHGKELCDLSEEQVRSIRVPMLGAVGTLDPEVKYMKRLEGVVEGFEFVACEGLGHDGLAASQVWTEIVLGFMAKQSAKGGRGEANGNAGGTGAAASEVENAPQQAQIER